MASTIKVDQIEGSTGSTITVPTGQTLTLTDGLASASLPVVGVAKGGTSFASFTAGDVLYATGSTTLAKLPKGTAEQVLAMNSGATAPDWGSVDLTVLPTISVAKGGTNLSSFTAGDVLYATGATTLAKLAKGSAADVLTMNAGATAPEWAAAAAGGKIGQVLNVIKTDRHSVSSSSWVDITDMTLAITPSATDSKILWSYHLYMGSNDNYGKIQIVYGDDSALTTTAIGDASSSRTRATSGGIYDPSSDNGLHVSMQGLDAPNTTSATTYKLQWRLPAGTIYLNRRVWDTDNAGADTAISTLTLMEVLA